jgi:hypothetical protein
MLLLLYIRLHKKYSALGLRACSTASSYYPLCMAAILYDCRHFMDQPALSSSAPVFSAGAAVSAGGGFGIEFCSFMTPHPIGTL